MDRFVAATFAFVAALFPGNRRHQANRPGRHRPDRATRILVAPGAAYGPVRASVPAPGNNVMQNGTTV